jgi:hypothetical protein
MAIKHWRQLCIFGNFAEVLGVCKLRSALMKNGIEIDMRSSTRFPLRLPMAVKGEAQGSDGETENISAGGVLFNVDSAIAVGASIEFTISLPAGVLGSTEDVKVSCLGRVVRCDREGERCAVAAVIDEYNFQRT